ECELRLSAYAFGDEAILEGLRIVYGLVVHRRDDIAGFQASPRRRTLAVHVLDQDAGRAIEPETVGDLRGHALQRSAEPGALHLAARQRRLHHEPYHI